MDLLFEIVVELLLEGSLEISSNRKISKWIRYPILVMLILFFGVVIVGLFGFGIYIFKDSIPLSIIIIICSIIILVGCIIKFRKIYNEKK